MVGFIKQDGEKIIFTGNGELIFYVPEKYFDIKVASQIGEVIEVIGLFAYGLFDKNGKSVKYNLFKCPTLIECRPSSISKESALHLVGTREAKPYRLLHFKNGDEIICNVNIPKNVDNVEKFINLLTHGNLPEMIPYNELHEYILKNAELNGFNYKVSCQIIGILIGELCRDSKDLTKPFRLAGTDDMLAYTGISIKKVPKYTSPYTAITSENADEAIAAAITTKGTGESPLERVMMG